MIERLASSQGTKEQYPNIELANYLASKNDIEGIDEIAENLFNDNNAIAGDCIKVLYEIGNINPRLISKYIDSFINLLSSKNNRMVWGAMYAIAQTVPYEISKVDANFNKIVNAYKDGSVITIDCSITVFACIANANVSNSNKAFQLIINHLESCRPKEIPQHAERAYIAINKSNYAPYKNVLQQRLITLTQSQKRRVNKIIKNIESDNFV